MDRLKVRVDFNGLFGDILCLSHGDTCHDENGAVVHLREGLTLTTYDEDSELAWDAILSSVPSVPDAPAPLKVKPGANEL